MTGMLTKEQIDEKLKFIDEYCLANNAADGSKVDANANVEQKNIATLESELMKDYTIQIQRARVTREIEKLYGKNEADLYNKMIEDHEIYVHDESSLKSYCVSITMYPFLLDGMTKLGGSSGAPKHLASFCGNFVNLIFGISSQFAGAVASVEFLMMFDYFARKDFGENYLETNKDVVNNSLQHVVYALNQPAAARGYQSVFWNISLFDRKYSEEMFADFKFPDFTEPNWISIQNLQNYFMKWFNAERMREVLTFPVVTSAMLSDGESPVDKVYAEDRALDLSEGNSFFTYMSENADSLASCCRLKNEVADNDFSYSLGAGGVSTGSLNVIAINFNHIAQDAVKMYPELDPIEAIKIRLKTVVTLVQHFQIATRSMLQFYKDNGLLTVFDAGFIQMDKQFLTVGINGMLESAEFLGMTPNYNPEYVKYISEMLKIIKDLNKKQAADTGFKFNTEFVPAENLGVKNASWDKKDGYVVNRDCYNSYFFTQEDEEINVIDKFRLHGKETNENLDGGQANHVNLAEFPDKEQYLEIFNIAAKTGCNYFCTNIRSTACNNPECRVISKNDLDHCPVCGCHDVDHLTRVIGYLKRIKSFSTPRQREESRRFYDKV